MVKKYGIVFTSGDPRVYTGLTPTFLTFAALDGTSVAVPAFFESLTSSGLYAFSATLLPDTPIYFLADGTASAPTATRYIAGILDPSDGIDLQTTDLGSTLVGIGNTAISLGTTNVAIGVTIDARVQAVDATLIAQGSTLVGIGNTAIALGTTNVALGTTNVALGTTGVALGTTGIAIGTTSVSYLSGIDTKLGSTASVFGDSATDPVDVYGYLKRAVEFREGDADFNKNTGVWTVTDRAGLTTIASKTLANTVDNVTKT